MTLAVNFIVNNCFVFKLELMESFGSTQYDGAIGSVLRCIERKLYCTDLFHVAQDITATYLHRLMPNEKVEIFFIHASSTSSRACRVASAS